MSQTKKCSNCGEYKIGSNSVTLFLMAGLCFIFVITIPLGFIFLIMWLASLGNPSYICGKCNKKYTKEEYENLT